MSRLHPRENFLESFHF